jgi:hypothetical protein
MATTMNEEAKKPPERPSAEVIEFPITRIKRMIMKSGQPVDPHDLLAAKLAATRHEQ